MIKVASGIPVAGLTLLAVLAVPAIRAGAEIIYSCGFEASEGFTRDQLNGQQGWWGDPNGSDCVVTASCSSGGSQSVMITPDGGYTGNFFLEAERFFENPMPGRPVVTVSQDVMITLQDGADYVLALYNGNNLVHAIQFEYTGRIFVDGVEVGQTWPANQWRTLTSVLDFGEKTATVTYGGTQVYSGDLLYPDRIGVDNVCILTDDYVYYLARFCYDDLSVEAEHSPIGVETALDHDWVYQNAPTTTAGRHQAGLTLTLDDPNANTGYGVSVTADPADAVDIEATADPLVWHVKGGRSGSDPTGACTLNVTVTGDEGGEGQDAIDLDVRFLGDVDGSGAVNVLDKAQMNLRLNGLATPYPDRCFDLTGDGYVNVLDKLNLNRVLNGIPVP